MAQRRDLPTEYRYRAEELRAIAEITVAPEYRQLLLKCATDYDGMARRAETVQWIAATGSKPN